MPPGKKPSGTAVCRPRRRLVSPSTMRTFKWAPLPWGLRFGCPRVRSGDCLG
jgi:hypothetical protein